MLFAVKALFTYNIKYVKVLDWSQKFKTICSEIEFSFCINLVIFNFTEVLKNGPAL